MEIAGYCKNATEKEKRQTGQPESQASQICRCIMSTDFTPPSSATMCISPRFYPGGKNTVHFGIFTYNFTLVCESAIFMYKSKAESPRSPILRAFWRSRKSRRLDTEPPSDFNNENKYSKLKVSRKSYAVLPLNSFAQRFIFSDLLQSNASSVSALRVHPGGLSCTPQ